MANSPILNVGQLPPQSTDAYIIVNEHLDKLEKSGNRVETFDMASGDQSVSFKPADKASVYHRIFENMTADVICMNTGMYVSSVTGIGIDVTRVFIVDNRSPLYNVDVRSGHLTNDDPNLPVTDAGNNPFLVKPGVRMVIQQNGKVFTELSSNLNIVSLTITGIVPSNAKVISYVAQWDGHLSEDTSISFGTLPSAALSYDVKQNNNVIGKIDVSITGVVTTSAWIQKSVSVTAGDVLTLTETTNSSNVHADGIVYFHLLKG